jgi:hypothetical protein
MHLMIHVVSPRFKRKCQSFIATMGQELSSVSSVYSAKKHDFYRISCDALEKETLGNCRNFFPKKASFVHHGVAVGKWISAHLPG